MLRTNAVRVRDAAARLLPNRSEISLTVMSFLALSTMIIFSRVAFAQQVAPPAALATGTPIMLWASVAGILVHAAMSLVAPGTPTPWNLPASTRFYLGAALSALSGLASLLQTGATVQSALLTSLGTLIAALVAHAPQLAAKDEPRPGNGGGGTLGALSAGALLAAVAIGASGCTAAQSANDQKTANSVLSGLQQACVDAEMLAPVLDPSLSATDLATIKTACGLDAFADSVIQQAEALFAAQPAVAAQMKKVAAAKAHK